MYFEDPTPQGKTSFKASIQISKPIRPNWRTRRKKELSDQIIPLKLVLSTVFAGTPHRKLEKDSNHIVRARYPFIILGSLKPPNSENLLDKLSWFKLVNIDSLLESRKYKIKVSIEKVNTKFRVLVLDLLVLVFFVWILTLKIFHIKTNNKIIANLVRVKKIVTARKKAIVNNKVW